MHFRLEKSDEANSIGGLGPVATFQGPLVNPKLALLPPHLQGTGPVSQPPSVIPELDAADDTPLHTPRSADSANSMKSAFSTMHPTSLSGGQSIHSRRTTAAGEAAGEFEDVFDADDLELGGGRNDREDASLLRSNATEHSGVYSSTGELLTQRGAESNGRLDSESGWNGLLQSPSVQRFSQVTRLWGTQLREKYAEYRATHL